MRYGAERTPDFEETLRVAIEGKQAAMWTAMPGYVVSYDASGNGSGSPTVTVQLGIEGTILDITGKYNQVNLPLLPDVPVVFLNGGGVTQTFPIAKGDECLVVFASRCIDWWWKSGGIQPSIDARKHDINDGFAIVGPRSGKRPLHAVSTGTMQTRSDDGGTYIELDPSGHAVNIVAPGGVTITTPTLMLNGQQVATGTITSNTDVYAQTVSLFAHEHGGVTTGGGVTGVPIGGGGATAPGSGGTGTGGTGGGTGTGGGQIPVSQVTGAAPLASPALTGTPTTPTPAAGDASQQVADTAFVSAAVAVLAATIAAEFALQQAVNQTAAPLNSPTFIGTPAAPTAPVGTNTAQIATTAFVEAAIGSNSFQPSTFIIWLQSLPTTPPASGGIAWLNAGALCLS